MSWFFGSKKEEKPKDGIDSVSIKLDTKNLPKIDLKETGLKMPEKPKIKTQKELKQELLAKENAGKIAFDLEKEYDLTQYSQRFLQQVNRVNPLLFFTPTKRIVEA